MSWFTKLLPIVLSRATSTKSSREANVAAALEVVAAATDRAPAALPDAQDMAAKLLAVVMPTLPVDATLAELDELGVRLGQVIDYVRDTRRSLRDRADALRALANASATAAQAARERATQED